MKPKGKISNLKILIATSYEISEKLILVMAKGIRSLVFRARTWIEILEILQKLPDIDLVLMNIAMPVIKRYEDPANLVL